MLSDPVYWYRFNPGSMQKTTNYFVNRRRALRPYLNLIPESEQEVRHLLSLRSPFSSFALLLSFALSLLYLLSCFSVRGSLMDPSDK